MHCLQCLFVESVWSELLYGEQETMRREVCVQVFVNNLEYTGKRDVLWDMKL